jgi:hypothetical protein
MKMEYGNIMAGPSALAFCLAIAAVVFYVSGYQMAGSHAGSAIGTGNMQAGIPVSGPGTSPTNMDSISGVSFDAAPPTADLGDLQKNQPKTALGRYVKELGEVVSRE